MQILQNKNIYLMGFMGCGKSRIGRTLSDILQSPYVDSDEMIVEKAGMPITDIFNTHGEQHFRQLEKDVIRWIADHPGQIVSLGGGAIVDPDNWKTISDSGVTVNLSYPPEILYKRLANKTDRPLLDGTEGESRLERIRELLEERKPLYKRADFILHFNKEVDAEQVASAIAGYIRGAV